MSLTPRQVTKLSQALCGRSDRAVDETLDAAGVRDPADRISVKHAISAASAPRMLQAQTVAFEDEPRVTPDNEVDRWLKRSGIQFHKGYTLGEIDDLLQCAPFGPTEKIAMRIRLEERGLIAGTRAPSRSGRMLSAAADDTPRRGKLLVDTYGEPLTLQSVPG